jgi:hypothetical protein
MATLMSELRDDPAAQDRYFKRSREGKTCQCGCHERHFKAMFKKNSYYHEDCDCCGEALGIVSFGLEPHA